MKTTHLSFIAAVLLMFSVSIQAQTPARAESTSWKLYTINGEDFSVALPLLPARHTNYEWLEGSEKSRRVYSLGSYADGVAYMVYVYENPKRQSLNSFMSTRRTAKSPFTEVNVSGFPGKQNSGDDSMSQFFATKDRLYEFSALGASVDDARMTAFFPLFCCTRKRTVSKLMKVSVVPTSSRKKPSRLRLMEPGRFSPVKM